MLRNTRLWCKSIQSFSRVKGVNNSWLSNGSTETLLESLQAKSQHLHKGTKLRFFHRSCFCQNQSELDNNTKEKEKPGKLKRTGQLAKVFAEYGTTAVVFHTTISLTSLGISYMAVSSGIDVVALLQKVNLIGEATTEAKLAGGAGTFVIAYACHKVFMPARIFLTVSCTPIVVKKLRRMGFLKTPKKETTTD